MLGLIVAALFALGVFGKRQPAPPRQRCIASTGHKSSEVDLAQAHYASIIAGIAVRRGLPTRAASIAVTTAATETNLHNLDHGDRDSAGLFQQRPSQGWGTKKQVMNPYYATNEFYDRLIKIKHWKTAKISDIAQRIQISKFPEAYKDHEETGQVLGPVLTGHSSHGIRCLIQDQQPGDARGLAHSLRKTYQTTPKRSGRKIVIKASSDTLAWSYAQYAVANAREYGLSSAQVGKRRWTASSERLVGWKRVTPTAGDQTVQLTMRS